MTSATFTSQSRAVARTIEPGSSAFCPVCDLQVKFQARVRCTQVICNIYEAGRWRRVEHYHQACYTEAGEPFGPAT